MPDAFEIDARSIVAFRAGLGVAVLFELIDRWSVLPVFYADVGVAPVADLAPAHRCRPPTDAPPHGFCTSVPVLHD